MLVLLLSILSGDPRQQPHCKAIQEEPVLLLRVCASLPTACSACGHPAGPDVPVVRLCDEEAAQGCLGECLSHVLCRAAHSVSMALWPGQDGAGSNVTSSDKDGKEASLVTTLKAIIYQWLEEVFSLGWHGEP